MIDVGYGVLSIKLIAIMSGIPEISSMMPAEAQRDSTNGEQEGLDLVVLFGSISLFLAIVVAITLMRRWR